MILPFRVEYSTAVGRSIVCQKCRKAIARDGLQLGIMQQSKTSDSVMPEWYDIDCFLKRRRPVSVDLIDGFYNLRYHHQMEIQSKLGFDVNASHTSTFGQSSQNKTEHQIEQQNAEFFAIYDQLKCFNGADVTTILKENNQFVSDRPAECLNHLTDIICFGALARCAVCQDGKLVLQGSKYRCTGYDSSWSTCINSVKVPQRVPVKLSPEYQSMLKDKPQVRIRILRDSIDVNPGELELHTKQPLFNMEFFIIGATNMPRNEIEYKIKAMGGQMASRIHSYLTAVISNAEEVENSTGLMRDTFIHRVQVVPDSFLDEVMDNDPIEVIVQRNLNKKWSKHPYERIPELKPANLPLPSTSYCPKKTYFNLDPVTGDILNEAKVFCGDARYEATLTFVDIMSNKNSFLKLQLLNNNSVRESTGRISASVRQTQTEQNYSTVNQAQEAFKKIYKEKTGNEFGVKVFVKKPGMWHHIDVDNETLAKISRNPKSVAPPTKLSSALYELMELLYSDDKVLRKSLIEFCFDLDSMPLGKLNKTQIQAALNLLVNISALQLSTEANEIVAASNQFYSYFPHNFGHRRPFVINSYKIIQDKINMLQHLLENELKYEFLTSNLNKEKHLLDLCYDHLQESAEITMLNKASQMYAQICGYVKNTQLHDSSPWQLPYFNVDEIFEVTRHEEIMRYEPYERNFNRQLLFHGTRISNFVGILTNGLKISPPEAIFSGSIFGTGIYFSDSVSKSASYCRSTNGMGLVLLCEVAAGRADIRYTHDKSKLIKHCESVQALGQYYPHPLHIRPDGLKIPNGKLVRRTENTGIPYNEFVVSDVARVKIRYLVKLKFNNQAKVNTLPVMGFKTVPVPRFQQNGTQNVGSNPMTMAAQYKSKP